MNTKWMPITAGIIDIVYGAFGVIYGPFAVIFITIYRLGHREDWHRIIGPVLIITGILSIIGGINIIKNKRQSLALIGSICTLFLAWGFFWAPTATPILFKCLTWIPAIVAVVLTILSRKQFSK